MNLINVKKMREKVGIFLVFAALLGTMFYNMGVIYAQVEDGFSDEVVKTDAYALDVPIEVKSENQLKREQFLRNVRAELRATQKELYDLQANVVDTENRLDRVQGEVTTLSGQLNNLNSQIYNTESLIKNVRVQIVEKENRLKVLYGEMEMKKIEIANQKQMLLEYIRTIYEHENAISDTLSGNENINIVKLLLSDKSISEQLREIKYLNILEKTEHELFETLEQLVAGLEQDQLYVDEQRIKLTYLQEQLELERRNLELQKEAKASLLQQTRGEERIYASLLEESKQQHLQIQEDIKFLRDALKFIQEKMLELGDAFNVDDYQSLFTGEKISVYEFINATKDATDIEFDWPVSPGGGISAYFRDPSYAAVFGVRHNAIDLRVPQETMIRAPADGVVYKVRDNGFGYSYLMVAHRGGFVTVYGHIPQFLVEPGEKVFKGQAIALSGGIPGTKGAGLMTTGAHLHFEIMKGGSYVDPLLYMPLGDLPSIPEKYKAFVTHEPSGKAVSFLGMD